ncbi:MAG: hypothetical protein HOK80_01285, partial [Candidatus Cloacimonetes bacterium]|nr:hypothetical protein [Candidatus Cloacimonadota bacterium]
MKKFLLIIAILAIGVFVIAQNSLILDIKTSGNENIETELIRSLILFEIGENYNPEDISESISNLHQLGVFKDIRIEKEELPQGLSVSIFVVEYPIVDQIDFSGNKKLSDKNIQDK